MKIKTTPCILELLSHFNTYENRKFPIFNFEPIKNNFKEVIVSKTKQMVAKALGCTWAFK